MEIIATIFVVLWLLGIVSGYTLGNFIYVLLVVAIVLFLVTAWQSSRSSGGSTGRSGTSQP